MPYKISALKTIVIQLKHFFFCFSLVYLAVSILEDAKLPGPQLDAKSFLGLDKARQVSAILLKTIHNILLFPYGYDFVFNTFGLLYDVLVPV